MITPEHEQALSYHPLVPGRAELHETLRTAAKGYAATIDTICPPSRYHERAFEALHDSLMLANAAVAIHQDRLDLPDQGPPMDPQKAPMDPLDHLGALFCAAAAGRELTLELDKNWWTAVFVHVDGRLLTTVFGWGSEIESTLAQIFGQPVRAGTYQGPPAEAGEEIEIPPVQTTGEAVEKLTGRTPEAGQ